MTYRTWLIYVTVSESEDSDGGRLFDHNLFTMCSSEEKVKQIVSAYNSVSEKIEELLNLDYICFHYEPLWMFEYSGELDKYLIDNKIKDTCLSAIDKSIADSRGALLYVIKSNVSRGDDDAVLASIDNYISDLGILKEFSNKMDTILENVNYCNLCSDD